MIEAVIIALNVLILAYFIAMNSAYTVLLGCSFVDIVRNRWRRRAVDLDSLLASSMALPVSIIAPAFDEESTIVDSVRSLLKTRYPEFEVVVVDDGSNDRTFEVLREAFLLKPVHSAHRVQLKTQNVLGIYRAPGIANLTVVKKVNGGKSDALNAGINVSRYPLFCAIDADSIIDRDALMKVVVPFMESPVRTIAAGGSVRTANGCTIVDGEVKRVALARTILPLFQTVEYLRAFLFGRIGWNLLGGNLIISGAFGVFRKDAVVSVGGYSTHTIGEDMELVIRLHRWHRDQKIQYRIVFVPDPICFTQVPERLRDLGRQRDRWQRGLMESMTMHWRMAGHVGYGRVGLVSFPFYVFFELLSPLIELGGYVLVGLSFWAGIIDAPFLVMFFLVAVLYGVFLSVATVLLEEISFALYRTNSSVLWLSLFGLLENFGYRQLTLLWRFRGMIRFLYGAKGWGKMQRQTFGEARERPL